MYFIVIYTSLFDDLVFFKAITHLDIKALDRGLKIGLKVKWHVTWHQELRPMEDLTPREFWEVNSVAVGVFVVQIASWDWCNKLYNGNSLKKENNVSI